MGNFRRSWQLPVVTALAGALLGSGVTAGTIAGEAAPAGSGPVAATSPPVRSYAPVAARVVESVVLIRSAAGLGSGVVLDGNGNILTNAHVAGHATDFRVKAGEDRTVRPAHLVGSYPAGDLAVIRVDDPSGLRPARFGDSGSVRVGDVVLAVGNPLGLTGSVTDGIVSATGRTVTEPATGQAPGATLRGVIQTSAPINPGNSGGALVNMSGEVIGIPTLAAASLGSGAQAAGIGFAIPSDTARHVASRLIAAGQAGSSPRAGPASGDAAGPQPQGVTPDRFSPMIPARTSPIDTILMTDTDSPRTAMPTAAVPAAPIPVHRA